MWEQAEAALRDAVVAVHQANKVTDVLSAEAEKFLEDYQLSQSDAAQRRLIEDRENRLDLLAAEVRARAQKLTARDQKRSDRTIRAADTLFQALLIFKTGGQQNVDANGETRVVDLLRQTQIAARSVKPRIAQPGDEPELSALSLASRPF